MTNNTAATVASLTASGTPHVVSSNESRRVIFASTIGTAFEFYEFFLYSALATHIGKHFLSSVDPTAAYIFALLAFAAGFLVRPLGALVFGWFGDLMGRKYTFLATVLVMGLATMAVGVLPTYSSIGIAAPILLIVLRMLQGLALGGEYGGAAVYLAEHAPPRKRNQFTSWLQFASTLGLVISLLVVMACRESLPAESFDAWGWRIPFLLSLVILVISVWLRISLKESPLFEQARAKGKLSKAPFAESFGRAKNLRLVFVAMFGICAGMGVIWFVAQIYTLVFLTRILKMDAQAASLVLTIALIVGIPVYLIVGIVSDRIGRKPVIVAGCLIAVVTIFPIFKAITQYVNPALARAQAQAPVVVVANPNDCSFQFNPLGTSKFTLSCDVAKSALTTRGIPYTNEPAPAGTIAQIKIGSAAIPSYDGRAADAIERGRAFNQALAAAVANAKYPTKADPAEINYPMLLLLLSILVVYAAITYSPTAAALVELFPTRIRYTSVSLPYHLGVGWFGGLLPASVVAIQSATGSIYDGLWYPIVIIVISLAVAILFYRETKDVSLEANN